MGYDGLKWRNLFQYEELVLYLFRGLESSQPVLIVGTLFDNVGKDD